MEITELHFSTAITFLITSSCLSLFASLSSLLFSSTPPTLNPHLYLRPCHLSYFRLSFLFPCFVSLDCTPVLRFYPSPLYLLCLFQTQIKIQMLTLSVFPCLFWAFLAIFTSQCAFFCSIALETKGLGEFTCPYGNRGTQGVRLRCL